MSFVASVFVTEQLNKMMLNTASELARRAVAECAKLYNFDAEDALKQLDLSAVKLEKKVKEIKEKVAKVKTLKPRFPLPYSGEYKSCNCEALCINGGLYTQCINAKSKNGEYCKKCVKKMEKAGLTSPEFGTMTMRKSAEIMDYVDPKGNKPTPYAKIMKKHKVSDEDVREEASKFGIDIDEVHFKQLEDTGKRGRKKTEKAEKPVKSSKGRGRPKKSLKIIEVDGEEEDLFQKLIENANAIDTTNTAEDEEDETVSVKSNKSDDKKRKAEEKEAEKKRKAEEKEAEKKRKAEEKEAEKKRKEEEKEAEKKRKAEEKEAEKKRKEEEKKRKESEKKKVEEEPEEEQEVLKVVKHEGVKYLRSMKSNIVYDYNAYTNNEDMVVVGQYDAETKLIKFNKEDDEEEEVEEYDE
jgi:colicin import membrane protein